MTYVKIEWEAPRTVRDVLDNLDEEGDKGLYQIYGRHILFGPGTLVYIGKTGATNTTQTFKKRISTHRRDEWFSRDEENNDLEIRIGRIMNIDGSDNPSDWQDWDGVLSRVEALQIYSHSPPYNSQNINTPPDPQPSIENTGYRGQLAAKLPRDQEDLPPNGRTRLAVTIRIECPASSRTFVDVIKKIGIELVKSIQDEHDIRPKLISENPPRAYYKEGSYYVNVGNAIPIKKEYLDRIAAHLNIQCGKEGDTLVWSLLEGAPDPEHRSIQLETELVPRN